MRLFFFFFFIKDVGLMPFDAAVVYGCTAFAVFVL